jgi:hypothetical protein
MPLGHHDKDHDRDHQKDKHKRKYEAQIDDRIFLGAATILAQSVDWKKKAGETDSSDSLEKLMHAAIKTSGRLNEFVEARRAKLRTDSGS